MVSWRGKSRFANYAYYKKLVSSLAYYKKLDFRDLSKYPCFKNLYMLHIKIFLYYWVIDFILGICAYLCEQCLWIVKRVCQSNSIFNTSVLYRSQKRHLLMNSSDEDSTGWLVAGYRNIFAWRTNSKISSEEFFR